MRLRLKKITSQHQIYLSWKVLREKFLGHTIQDIQTQSTAYSFCCYIHLSIVKQTSKISFIDGDKGILTYRGYPIEQLAEKSTFLEVAFLLVYGELPTAADFQKWQRK